MAFFVFKHTALRACRAGSAAAEFALVVPLLMTFMFGIIEFGSVFFSYSAMQFAAHDAARQIAVNVAGEPAALTAAAPLLPGWARDDVAMAVTQSNPGDPNTNVIRVRMVANAQQLAVVSMITRLVPWTLTADASIKQELPYVD